MSSTANMMRRMPSVFAGAFGSALPAVGVWNFVSSSREWPSGVRTIATSTRTSSSPTTRSTQRPSTAASPSSSRPSSTKNAVAASRSSTTTPTWSIRWIVMLSLLGVVRPRWPHLPLGRSRQAVLDILGHVVRSRHPPHWPACRSPGWCPPCAGSPRPRTCLTDDRVLAAAGGNRHRRRRACRRESGISGGADRHDGAVIGTVPSIRRRSSAARRALIGTVAPVRRRARARRG